MVYSAELISEVNFEIRMVSVFYFDQSLLEAQRVFGSGDTDGSNSQCTRASLKRPRSIILIELLHIEIPLISNFCILQTRVTAEY